MEYYHTRHDVDECNIEDALESLHNLCENLRMKYGSEHVWNLEMAIDCLQRYRDNYNTVCYSWSDKYED